MLNGFFAQVKTRRTASEVVAHMQPSKQNPEQLQELAHRLNATFPEQYNKQPTVSFMDPKPTNAFANCQGTPQPALALPVPAITNGPSAPTQPAQAPTSGVCANTGHQDPAVTPNGQAQEAPVHQDTLPMQLYE